jgi:hypothetical protein
MRKVKVGDLVSVHSNYTRLYEPGRLVEYSFYDALPSIGEVTYVYDMYDSEKVDVRLFVNSQNQTVFPDQWRFLEEEDPSDLV